MKKIYIIHGWSYSIEKWDEIVSLLNKKRVSATVLKVPGLIYPIKKPWTINDYVSWLYKKLTKEKKVLLVGHSNGGRIVLAFVKRYPDKISKLILIDSAGVYGSSISLKIKRMIFGNLARIGKKFTTSKTLKNILYKFAHSNDYNRADLIMKKTMLSLVQSDIARNFENVQVPTTIIWGENDSTTPLADGKLLSKTIKNSKLFVIKNAKHSPQFSHPREVADIIANNI